MEWIRAGEVLADEPTKRVGQKPRRRDRRRALTDRWRRLHESLTFGPDDRGVTSTDNAPQTARTRVARTAVVSIALACSAALVLVGCGSPAEDPVRPAAVRSAGPAAAPATTAVVPPPVAPVPDTDQSLADVDRALADLDSQLSDADHDVATPEGDLR
jgi:hypothetical protein